MKVITTDSSSETEKTGHDFASLVKSGEIVALVGELGAGKTTFVRGFIRGLGYDGPVRSPSYTLSNRYPTNPEVTHMDLFRLKDSAELIALNLEEESEERILLVEWGDRFNSEWGNISWIIKFVSDNDHGSRRVISIERL